MLESILQDAETTLRQAKNQQDPHLAQKAQDYARQYLDYRQNNEEEPYQGADNLARDIESQAYNLYHYLD